MRCSQLAVETEDRPIALTASAGVASFPADGRSAEELVAKAATTVYTAQASGPGPGRVLLRAAARLT